MTGFPNQGRNKFQDEQDLFNFVTGAGTGNNAPLGVSGGGMFRRTASQVALAADTSTQSIFGASKGQFTVEAGKSYQFEGVIQINNGSTSHTTQFALVLATAVLANVRTHVLSWDGADDTPVAAKGVNLEVATVSAVNAAGTGVETSLLVWGTFDVTTAGTVQPAIAFGTNPTGTNTIEIGTWFAVRALGPSTIEKFGAVT